jgi:transcriptional regulator with XRE-family HTH domain
MPEAKTSAEIRRDWGRWFKKERESRGINQKFVADKVNMTVTQLSRIENGQSGTKRDTVIALAKTVGIDETEALRRYEPELFRTITHDGLASIDFAYEGLQTKEGREKADYVIEMLEREIERISEEERLRLAGNDATVNEDGSKTVHFNVKKDKGKKIFRDGGGD